MRTLAGMRGPKSTCFRSAGRSLWLSGYRRANCAPSTPSAGCPYQGLMPCFIEGGYAELLLCLRGYVDIRFGQVRSMPLCFFPVWKLAFLLWA